MGALGEITLLCVSLILLFIQFSLVFLFRDIISQINRTKDLASKNTLQEGGSLEIGSVFPSLQLPSITSKVINLANNRVEGTILLFSIFTCKACQKIYPNLNSLTLNFPSYQLVSVMVGPLSEIEDIKNKYNIGIPIHQIEMDQMSKYGTTMFPFGYILSNSGKVIQKGVIHNEESINRLLSSIEALPI